MGSSIRKLWRSARLALAACLVSVSAARAQAVAPVVGEPAFVKGRVATPALKADVPIAGVMVTLHRVGNDSSGPVDSVRTDAAGNFAIKYRRSVSDEAIYFAAALYRGIAYFSSPIKSQRATGEEAEITVFDTTTRPIDLHVRGHHFVVSAPRPDGTRNIVEVWELSNDTTVTLVQRDSASPVWNATLPAGAIEFSGGEGDVSAGSLVSRAGKVFLNAPFGPGVKQLSYSYGLPPGSFPIALPMDNPTVVLEVLVEEVGAQVAGAGLRSMPAATTGGRTFKRFLTQDVPAGSTVRVTVPVTTQALRTKVLVALACAIALVMIGALGRSLMRSNAGARRVALPARQTHEDLVAAIAMLDARKDRADPTLDEAGYTSQRAMLKAKLLDALAGSGRTT